MKILASILLFIPLLLRADNIVKLQWSKSNGAAGYTVETSLDDKSISISKDVGNRTNYSIVLPSNANYLIKVTPYDRNNISGVSSDYIKYIGVKIEKPIKMDKITLKIIK